MFSEKKTSLLPQKSPNNLFIKSGLRQTSKTVSENNAKKYTTSGDPFVDQFLSLSSYRSPRSFVDISRDCELLWSKNPQYAVRFIFFIRMISRFTNLFSGISTASSQKGAELKHEGIMRMLWLHTKNQNIFWANITLFIAIGSWKDIFQMLKFDLVFHGWEKKILNWGRMENLILSGLTIENQVNLVKKYLPQVKANSKCTTVDSQANTIIAKWICSFLFEDKPRKYQQYRLLKSKGTAHQWQQLISQRRFNEIDFSTIHGIALSKLVKSKFLFNHNLSDKYNEWVSKDEVKTVKFTGFVTDLFAEMGGNPTIQRYNSGSIEKYQTLVSVPEALRHTTNKQFLELVSKHREKLNNSFLVCIDSSGSMASVASGLKISCYNVAKSLALFFSYFLQGSFSNAYAEFSRNVNLHEWIGDTPLEKWFNAKTSEVANTNFLSVIELFAQLKKTVPESEFPKGIICITDGEFDRNPQILGETNILAAKSILAANFSKEYCDNFKIVLWQLQSASRGSTHGKKFETYGPANNVYYFSGYSPSIISFLTSEIKNSHQLVYESLDQEILNMIRF